MALQYNTLQLCRPQEPPRADSISPFIKPRVNNSNQLNGHAHICLGSTRNLHGTSHGHQPAVDLRFGTMETTGTATSITSHHRPLRNFAHRYIPIYLERIINFRPIPKRKRHTQGMLKFRISRKYLHVPAGTNIGASAGNIYYFNPKLQDICSTGGSGAGYSRILASIPEH